MATQVTTTELRKMTPADLLKEIRTKEGDVVKLRLGVKLGKEKDSAKYIREKKQLARMKTVYSEVSKGAVAPAKETKETASKEAKKSVSSASSKKSASPSQK